MLLVAVTGSQEPYIYDLPHLLSLPAKFEFRFRYRPRWVAPELLAQVRHDSRGLSGCEAVILFHSQDNGRLLPIRRATMVRIEELGPMVFVRFRVGDLADIALRDSFLRSDAAECIDPGQAHDIASCMLEGSSGDAKRDYKHPLGDGMYLRTAGDDGRGLKWCANGGARAWGSLVEILQKEPSLEGVPMFRLLGFEKNRGRIQSAIAIRNRFWGRRERVQGFRLVEHRRYRLRILEWAEPPRQELLPTVRVQCEFDPNVLDLEGASGLVVGRYDALEFTFVARTPGYIEMAVRAEPLRKDTVAQSQTPPASRLTASGSRWMNWPTILAVRIPLKVSYNKWRIALALACGLGGIAAYLFSGSISARLTGSFALLMGVPIKEASQVIGLYVLLISWGSYVDRFLRVRKEVMGVGGTDRSARTIDM